MYFTYMKRGTGAWYTMKGTEIRPSSVPGMVSVYRAGKFIGLIAEEASK